MSEPSPRRSRDAIQSPRPWWRLKRTYYIGVPFFLVASYFVLFVGTAVFPLMSRQDQCAFGEVSNARYRELLKEAKPIAQRAWPDLRRAVAQRSSGDFTRAVQTQIDELTKGMTSVQERIAATHAVMRANWAQYSGSWPNVNDPFSDVEKRIRRSTAGRQPPFHGIGAVFLDYRVNLLWFGDFSPLFRWAHVSARFYLVDSITKRNGVEFHHDRNTIAAFALIPHFPKGLAKMTAYPERCPPFPDAVWQTRFLSADQQS